MAPAYAIWLKVRVVIIERSRPAVRLGPGWQRGSPTRDGSSGAGRRRDLSVGSLPKVI